MNDLENLLRASIQIDAMRKALLKALPLMRKEYASVANPSTSCGAFIAACMQADANQWADAILDAENALKPFRPFLMKASSAK